MLSFTLTAHRDAGTMRRIIAFRELRFVGETTDGGSPAQPSPDHRSPSTRCLTEPLMSAPFRRVRSRLQLNETGRAIAGEGDVAHIPSGPTRDLVMAAPIVSSPPAVGTSCRMQVHLRPWMQVHLHQFRRVASASPSHAFMDCLRVLTHDPSL